MEFASSLVAAINELVLRNTYYTKKDVLTGGDFKKLFTGNLYHSLFIVKIKRKK